MTITGARVAIDAIHAEQRDLVISNGRLSSERSFWGDSALDLSGYLLLPGLINSHDHLEFNLFPRLGSGPYPNAKAWAEDIYHPEQSPLRDHLRVSKRARLLWGGIKNLISGATTVAHHNAIDHECLDEGFPVKVVRQFGWSHSLDFSHDMKDRWAETPSNWPFVVHAGEGTDKKAGNEIRQLEEMHILDDRTILVHAIGFTQADLNVLHQRGTAVVWCPSSNLSIYGRTLSCRALCSGLKVALGTDSALTAQGDLIDEISVARRSSGMPMEALYDMVTARAASIFRLTDGEGALCDGGCADLVGVRDEGQTPAEALENTRPEIVLVDGAVRLVSEDFRNKISPATTASFHPLRVEGRGKIWLDVDIPALLEETTKILGQDIFLAGKRVC